MAHRPFTAIRAIAVVFVALIVCAAATGCGSDNPQNPGDTQPATTRASTDQPEPSAAPAGNDKASFVRRANALCVVSRKEISRKLEAVGSREVAKDELNDLAEEVITVAIVPGFEDQVRQLEALAPPPKQRKQYDEVIAAIRQMAEEAKTDPISFAHRSNPYSKPEAIASRSGLTNCGHP